MAPPAGEEILFANEEEDLYLTKKAFYLDASVFQLNQVENIQLLEEKPGMAYALAGFLFLAGSLVVVWWDKWAGATVIGLGFVRAVTAKTTYAIEIKSALGRRRVYQSRDREPANSFVQAARVALKTRQ